MHIDRNILKDLSVISFALFYYLEDEMSILEWGNIFFISNKQPQKAWRKSNLSQTSQKKNKNKKKHIKVYQVANWGEIPK